MAINLETKQSFDVNIFPDCGNAKSVSYWLESRKALSVFVSNRIKELKIWNDIQYEYVKTEENPADVATCIFDKEVEAVVK
uniref:Uncharacterized protein n=1 Tax=Romanomermis culicivorax TaxID=13658 RepID=A0A915HHU4_ROMCU